MGARELIGGEERGENSLVGSGRGEAQQEDRKSDLGLELGSLWRWYNVCWSSVWIEW